MHPPTSLATYEQQLNEIIDALTLDPERQDLLDLKAELENLISLTEELVAQQKPAASSSSSKGKGREHASSHQQSAAPVAASFSPIGASSGATGSQGAEAAPTNKPAKETHKFSAGDECVARYHADGKWYPARITSTGGSSLNPVYSVVFKGYSNPEQVNASEIRPTKEQLEALARKRAGPELTPEEEARQAAKKRKTEKKVEKFQTKSAEAKEKQQAWQKFATKGAKKGYAIAGATGRSMFRTPDDPMAKVGVVGAGRGMTSNTQRSKHIYEQKD